MIADCRITNAQIRCVRIANSHEQCTNRPPSILEKSFHFALCLYKKGIGQLSYTDSLIIKKHKCIIIIPILV